MEDLMIAARKGDVEALYNLIRWRPNILEEIADFVDTPLHVAASSGHTHFAITIMGLKPSLGRKLNPDWKSPLDVALRSDRKTTVQRLVKFDSELIRVKGRDRFTPLHQAAQTDDFELVAEFLCACPGSIEDLTIRDETAMHVAVKNRSYNAFAVLLEWVWRNYRREVINWKDEDGNTVLHIAASTHQLQIVELLMKKAPIIVNERNAAGKTTLDLVTKDANCREAVAIRRILRREHALESASLPKEMSMSLGELSIAGAKRIDVVYTFVHHCRRKLSLEMRNVVLVVAVLIATATFQATLSPPGGINIGEDMKKEMKEMEEMYDDKRYGMYFFNNFPLSSGRPLIVLFHDIFYFFNTLAFAASIMVIILVLPWKPYSFLLHVSLLFIAISYASSTMFYMVPSVEIGLGKWHDVLFIWQMAVSIALPFLAYLVRGLFWYVDMEVNFEFSLIWLRRGWPFTFFWRLLFAPLRDWKLSTFHRFRMLRGFIGLN